MTGADAKVAADFKAVWDQFKATRENEIIPAIYKGNASDAKKIADGIQADRLSKMWDIMSCSDIPAARTGFRVHRVEANERASTWTRTKTQRARIRLGGTRAAQHATRSSCHRLYQMALSR